MTVSTTAAKELNINQIVLLAHRAASLVSAYQNVTESQRLAALDLLETIVNGTATQGRFARVMDWRSVTLVTAQWQYPMPTDVIDVVETAMWIDPTQVVTLPAREIPVTPVSRGEWQVLQPKDAEGPPSRYYCHRETDPVTIYIWPNPTATEAGGVIRFPCHRLRATMAEGQKTPDFERFWQQYFIYELAHQLAVASAIDTERCTYLGGLAQQKLRDCRGTSNQQGVQYLQFGHSTPWSR